MLSIPQPSISRQIGLADAKGGSPVPLSEDAQSMERFLMFCYPSIDPELDTLEEVQRILEMMRKYEVGGVKGRLVKILMAHSRAQPLGTVFERPGSHIRRNILPSSRIPPRLPRSSAYTYHKPSVAIEVKLDLVSLV